MARIEYHKKKSIPIKGMIIGLLFAVVLVFSSILLLLYPFPSSEKVDYFNGENPILLNGKQHGNAIIEENGVYVPLTFMKDFIDEAISFDQKSQSIIITTKDKVIQMPSKSLTYFINEKPVKVQIPPIKDKSGTLYVALDSILDYYPIKYTILKSTNAIWIQQNGESIQSGKIINQDINEKKLRLRTKPDIQSPFTAQMKRNEKLFIEKEKGEFYFVRKENGIAGFVNKEFVIEVEKKKIIVKHKQKKLAIAKMKHPFHLTWEAVYSANANPINLPKMPGVNVVSPTWFELLDKDGTIKNKGSTHYVKWAKKNGYKVWGLFSNAFDPKLTHDAFKNFETRQKMIRQLLIYSQMYNLDGINIDIENVYKEDGPLITQFMREATPYFHEAGLVVSMDITFISGDSNWSAFYEREQLAQIVDYMIVMAYDEHWGSSPVAGSVASLPWVEKNLQRLLEEVPHHKLILGVPLYTRLWMEKDNGKISSKALSMEAVHKLVKKKHLKPKYDKASGQNYVEYYSKKKKTAYKIWIEDEYSLNKRAKLAHKYDLVGVASWSRYFGDETAWTALNLENKTVTKK